MTICCHKACFETLLQHGWELVAYFSAAEARKLAKGMTAVVTPSTVKAEREGGIRGKVMEVGTFFETPESIQCDFRNNAFTQWIMSRTDGMPVKVRRCGRAS